ncbi:unnamed protein product [Penicillium salamii]|nr:unnamed protein product [Penicillium salamii]
MHSRRNISLVSSHCEGEAGDVIVGGVLDLPAKTMHEKLVRYMTEQDDLRRLLLHEPRGRPEMSVMLVVPPCDPRADAGFLIMAPGIGFPCPDQTLFPSTLVRLDTAAGLITANAECVNGKCKSVSFDNVPAFVYAIDKQINVPGLGNVAVDIAYGGQWYVIAQAKDLNTEVKPSSGAELIDFGKRLKEAVLAQCMPTHPANPAICGINNIIISEPLVNHNGMESVKHAVIVTPGRLDRSPCGTGSSARLAVLHARGQLGVGEKATFRSVIDTEFIGHIRDLTKVQDFDAVLPTIQGRAWITGERQLRLDPTDPFPTGFVI